MFNNLGYGCIVYDSLDVIVGFSDLHPRAASFIEIVEDVDCGCENVYFIKPPTEALCTSYNFYI